MMFIYKDWENFCKKLDGLGIHSCTACSLLKGDVPENFLVLKHDVETNAAKALQLAKIEAKYHHKGVYYVQAYLLENQKNMSFLKRIQELGHEVSYHYDVMDSQKGNIDKAIKEFQKNVEIFQRNGFQIHTVCQHGNPIIERVGYHSNRDFFRNLKVSVKYSSIVEIMVNLKEKIGVDYKYISDVGYGWKIIYDPETNDIVNSDEKNTPIGTLDNVAAYFQEQKQVIVSTHPHRWHMNVFLATVKEAIFKVVKIVANALMKIPIMKKLMAHYYYLAKKI